jgi:hypothetical protein
MTTVAQLITDAFQYNSLIATSAIPTASEQDKALRYLNRIFKSIFGNEFGIKLTPWDIDSSQTSSPFNLPENGQFTLNLSNSTAVYLSSSPQDGARFAIQDAGNNLPTYNLTIIGNGRTIERNPYIVLDSASFNGQWFYRADTANWYRVTDLVLMDDFPLPEEFEEYFITMLGMRLNANENLEMNAQLNYVMKTTMRKLQTRYRQKVEIGSEAGLINIPSNTWSYFTRFENG